MNLLGSVLYDPAVAVSKATTSLLAMTALDTTNLRVAVTVPSHGRLRFRMRGAHHGSTTNGQHLFGVLKGATVVARAPTLPQLLGTAIATTQVLLEADFTVSGLTPGAANFDAAYGVEIVASAGGAIKYGGPNDTTTNNAFGGFLFEVWDPSPNPTNFGLMVIDANGRLDISKVAGTAQTARDLGGQLDAAVSTRSTYAGTDTAGTTTLLSRIASALTITTGKVDVNDKTGFSLSAGGVQAIWDALTSALTTVGSIGKLIVTNLDALISSRSTYAGGDTAGVTTLLTRIVGTLLAGNHNAQSGDAFARVGAAGAGLTALGDARLANLDATITSRLAAASYSAPPSAVANASAVRAELAVELARIDAAISTRLASAGYTAPPSAAANASAVRTELATELAQITLAKKILKNRTDTNPTTGIMTVFDDDGVTPLLTANLYSDVAGTIPYDGLSGVNRRNALT